MKSTGNGGCRLRKPLALFLAAAMAVTVVFAGLVPAERTEAASANLVTYSGHQQTYGNLSSVKDGATLGVTGQSKRIESITVNKGSAISGVSGNIMYRVHVQTYGTTGWKKNGTAAGTTGESKRLEAVQMYLTGDLAEQYDIYYRVHIQSYGWLAWVKGSSSDSGWAGSSGLSKRMEAIQIVLVEKGSGAPSSSGSSSSYGYITKDTGKTVIYSGHQQSYGDLAEKADSAVLGVTGQSKRLESISIRKGQNLSGVSGDIVYRVHAQSYGNMAWVKNGAVAGTSGESKRVEAIQAYLTGELAEKYDIYYRAHVQSIGWTSWVKGSSSDSGWCGTTGRSLRIEAIQVKIVAKSTVTHSYTSKVTTAATCTSTGVRTYTCSVCGDTYTETITALGHDYEVTATKAATCVTAGSKTYTCTRCGDTYTETIAATGNHSYKLTSSKDATCTAAGSKTYTCSICGDSYTETVSATGDHDYQLTETVDATCVEDGHNTYTCSVCGDSYTEAIAATGHTADTEWTVTKEATSSEYGTKAILCTSCGTELETKNYALEQDNSQGIQVNYHSQADIIAYLEENSVVISSSAVTFETEPTLTAPYATGKVSDESEQEALDLVNAIRYIAGIDDTVTLDDDYIEKAQGACLVNYLNYPDSILSHYPSQPSDMDDSLYSLCYIGASNSNLACGYSSLTRSILAGWMGDYDSSNIADVGHRRWILYPDLEKTGFGFVSGYKYYGYYSAMYIGTSSRYIGISSNSSNYYGVAWPAQNMPVEYFEDYEPWSISMDCVIVKEGSTINFIYPDISEIEVTLTRISDGETWVFSEDSSDGYFNVSNVSCGQAGCIIFRPSDISYEDGDQFAVTITGLPEEFPSQTVSYQVNFFSVEE